MISDARKLFSAALEAVRDGRLAEAEALLRRVLLAEPTHPGAMEQLGIVCFRIGKGEEAVHWLGKAVDGSPDSELTRNNLGVVLEAQGRFAEAAESYGKALAINPKRAVLHFNLGNVLRSLGKLGLAEASFRTCVALDENHAQAWHNWGALRRELGDAKEAERLLRKALQLAPEMVDAQVNLGSALQSLGRDEEALHCYREALRLAPGYSDAQAGEISVLDRLGQTEEACARIEPLLQTGEENADVLLTFASLSRPLHAEKRATSLLESLLKRGGLLPSKREAALFALGKLYDASGHFAEAFSAYREANELRPHPFALDEFRAINRALRETFTAARLARLPRSREVSDIPVFVIGMPRSGTSLVEQILASHPDIHGAGELSWLDQFAANLPQFLGTGTSYPGCVLDFTVHAADRAASEYLALLRSLGGEARRVIDKMPGNFAHLALVQILFPGAKVIHIAREPLDNCLSCYFQNFTSGHHYAADLATLGAVYREYELLMTHWRKELSLPMLEVRYEDLITNQEVISRQMVEFCGLPWDDRCLRFHETKRVVRTASYDQVRQPIYRTSLKRWPSYEPFLDDLRSGLGGQAPSPTS